MGADALHALAVLPAKEQLDEVEDTPISPVHGRVKLRGQNRERYLGA